MPKLLRKYEDGDIDDIRHAIELLKEARRLMKRCRVRPKLLARTRGLLKAVEGADRHIDRLRYGHASEAPVWLVEGKRRDSERRVWSLFARCKTAEEAYDLVMRLACVPAELPMIFRVIDPIGRETGNRYGG